MPNDSKTGYKPIFQMRPNTEIQPTILTPTGSPTSPSFYWGPTPLSPTFRPASSRTGIKTASFYMDIAQSPRDVDVIAYIHGSSRFAQWETLAQNAFGEPFEPLDGPIILPFSNDRPSERIFDRDPPQPGNQRFLRLRVELPSQD